MFGPRVPNVKLTEPCSHSRVGSREPCCQTGPVPFSRGTLLEWPRDSSILRSTCHIREAESLLALAPCPQFSRQQFVVLNPGAVGANCRPPYSISTSGETLEPYWRNRTYAGCKSPTGVWTRKCDRRCDMMVVFEHLSWTITMRSMNCVCVRCVRSPAVCR